MKRLPGRTNEIFSILSKGKFISERGKNEKYFDIIKNNFKDLKNYFLNIDFMLEDDNGYFYFSKPNANEQEIERKIIQFEKFIDILDIFNSLDDKILIGKIFSISQIKLECENTARLREKLRKMNIEGKTNYEKIKNIIKELEKNNFVELYDIIEEKYIVLEAYEYLNKIVSKMFTNNRAK